MSEEKKIDEFALNAAGWAFVEQWPKTVFNEAMSAQQFNNLKALLRTAITKYLDEVSKP